VYWTTRPAASWFEPTSIALVLRLSRVESLLNSASRKRGIGERAGQARRRRARDALRGLDLELPLVGGGLEAVGLLVDRVAELDRGIGELLLHELVLDFAFDRRAHRLEALLLAAASAGDLDDVKAEVAFDDAARLARLQPEGGVLERLDHRAAAEEVEIAALDRRALVVGILLRDLGEPLRVLAHLGEQALGLGARLVALGLGRVLVGLDEDVAGAALLGRGVALLVLGVVLAQVVLGDGDVLLHRLEVEHHVLDRRLLGRLELAAWAGSL
jgi:hypothetical protein